MSDKGNQELGEKLIRRKQVLSDIESNKMNITELGEKLLAAHHALKEFMTGVLIMELSCSIQMMGVNSIIQTKIN